MYEVRSYDQSMHPDLFKGGGVLGFAIRCLNFLRWRLEVFVQYLTLQWAMREQNFSPKKRQEVLETFRLDVIKEKVEYKERSPCRPLSLPEVPSLDNAVKDAGILVPDETEYGPGRPIELLIEEFGFGGGRRRSRKGYENARDLFEALPPEDEGPDS